MTLVCGEKILHREQGSRTGFNTARNIRNVQDVMPGQHGHDIAEMTAKPDRSLVSKKSGIEQTKAIGPLRRCQAFDNPRRIFSSQLQRQHEHCLAKHVFTDDNARRNMSRLANALHPRPAPDKRLVDR